MNVTVAWIAYPQQYKGLDLLRQIIDPSATIKGEHRVFYIETEDGFVYNGLIVEQDEETITVAEVLQEPDDTVLVYRDEILEMEPLDISPMPTGLLVTLTHDEILDLVAFIAANGNEGHEVFSR